MRYFHLCVATIAFLFPLHAHASEPLDPSLARLDEESNVAWYDAHHLDIEGQGWPDESAPYTRLPDRAEKLVRPAVWNLSRDSAGVCVRFVTDAPIIHAAWTLRDDNLAMPHMPATGVSGLDLYAREGAQDGAGAWRWLAVGRPSGLENSVQLVGGLQGEPREFLLYLPLYNGVTSVEIGIPTEHTVAKADPYPATNVKPLVFYGTSITQGGCASRTGMVHTAMLGRRLNRPVINLGFSGNGRMEPEVAELIAEIDAAVYVIDCLPNISAEEVSERAAPLVKILRDKRPTTPILLVEDRTYSAAEFLASQGERNATSRAALRAAYESLLADSAGDLFYLEGDALLGDDNLGTVDGSHPTDLGFWRQANAFEPALRSILERPSGN